MHTNVIQLRQLLAERFPQVRMGLSTALASRGVQPTGVPGLDAVLGGGLPEGEVTELVGEGPGSGSGQVLHGWLRQIAISGKFLVLVDGADSFDAGSVASGVLSRLLWVRCRHAAEALQAMDLVLRDRNLPFVVLDLKLNPAAELRRIPGSAWHRFARLRESNQGTVLVVTPFPMVTGVARRVQVRGALPVGALSDSPGDMPSRLTFELLRTTAVPVIPVEKAG